MTKVEKDTWALGPAWVLEREVGSLLLVHSGAQQLQKRRVELEADEARCRR
jgi:hypothetical protein